MKEKFSLSTTAGCKRWIAIFMAVILCASFLAAAVSSGFGAIKIETIRIDSRGAELVGDLYYPAGTSDEDCLPAIVVSHGAGVSKNNYRSFAEELARRGYVVFNVNGYGTGLSEFPKHDENDMGEGNYDTWHTPSGILDAVNFVRTLNFVDQKRIGIAGHSQGSRRAGFSALLDCGYMTFNDIMINVMYEELGQSFTEEEIAQNADDLAAARLNDDQMAYYEFRKQELREAWDTTINSIAIIGGTASNCGPSVTVNVAGYDVVRNTKVNVALIGGYFDGGIANFRTEPTGKGYWYINDEMQEHTWYIIDDVTGTSKALGSTGSLNKLNSPELKEALDNGNVRMIALNPETHSKNFFSIQTAAEVISYFEAVFSYNNGELTDPATVPIPANNTRFVWREILNAIAMLGMVGLLMPMAALLLKTPFFKTCEGKNEINTTEYSKKRYWICMAVAAVGSFIAIWYINTLFAPGLANVQFWPLFPSWWLTPIYLLILAIVSIIELIVLSIIDKKKFGKSFVGGLNLKLGIVNVLKTILLAFVLIAVAYLSLALILYLFNQDYRLWMMAFEEMKVEQWRYVWRFALTTFPFFVITGMALNYANGSKMPKWLDMLITVVFNSLGVWVLATITTLVLHSSGASISNWTSTYGFIFFVPITVIISRKMYQITKSVWLGAAVNSLLIGWMMVCTIGYNSYIPQGWMSNFFNI